MDRFVPRVFPAIGFALLVIAVLVALSVEVVPVKAERQRASIPAMERAPNIAQPIPPLQSTSIYSVFLPLTLRYDGPRAPFGIQFYGSLQATTGFTYAIAAKTGWIRLQVLWSTIEPVNTTPSNYNWTTLDASVAAALEQRMNLILTLEGNPSWAASQSAGPVYAMSDLQEFVGAIVARYANVTYWEFYNEPDNLLAFGDRGHLYADVLNAVYPVVKAANPAAKVVMGGLAMDWCQNINGLFDCNFGPGGAVTPEFLDAVLANCEQPCFDVSNFHYYPVYRASWEPYGRDISGKANFLRQRAAQAGFNRPVINTETGWEYGETWGGPGIQARYVPKTFVRGVAAGLVATNWYAMIDADPSLPGLLAGSYPNYAERPSYIAFTRLTTLLGGATYQRALTAAETGSSYIEGYVLTTPGATALRTWHLVWYDCSSLLVTSPNLPSDCGTRVPYKVRASRIGLYDHLNAPVIYIDDEDDGQTDSWVTIPGGIGTDPVYIDFNP
ncbi:MAG TPA: hypothetical protein VIK33_11270 [Anaerolineae bacterium]